MFLGAFHYARDPGNFGRNSNGKVRFGFFWPEYSGSPLEVVHIFRSKYSDRNSPFHFWQTGSLPVLGNSVKEVKMARAISIGWPGLIGKCRSVFFRYSHWSLTGQFCIIESIQRFRKFRSEFKWEGPFRFPLTGICGITSGGGLHISVGIFWRKFAVPFLTNQFFALIREFRKRI